MNIQRGNAMEMLKFQHILDILPKQKWGGGDKI
jgi:hypothetical protein